MSNVIDEPSRSKNVIEPDVASVPPIRLLLPNCSKSIFALSPACETLISLSAKTDKDSNKTILINLFIFPIPSVKTDINNIQ